LAFLKHCDAIIGAFVRDEKVDSLDHGVFRRLADGLAWFAAWRVTRWLKPRRMI
jgi:hypothetical protein